ncbi:MAG TPA: hypothetical protein VIG55_09180 [Methylosinus sp.]
MSSMDGLERRADGVSQELLPSSPRSCAPLAVLVVGSTIVALLAAAFLAGYRVASIWSALSILAWMFVVGASRASE